MVKAPRYGQMVNDTKETSIMIKWMAKVCITIKMVAYTTDNGKVARKMEKELGYIAMVTNMKVILRMTVEKAEENTLMWTTTCMTGHSKITKWTDMLSSPFLIRK